MAYQGTLAGFSGDGIMIFFNDPLPLDNPAGQAVRMCIEMRARFAQLTQAWSKRGHELGLGIGIAQGFATLGVIGFEGRQDYGAIGTVCNLASRLCSEARDGQILVSQKVMGRIENLVQAQACRRTAVEGLAQARAGVQCDRARHRGQRPDRRGADLTRYCDVTNDSN